MPVSFKVDTAASANSAALFFVIQYGKRYTIVSYSNKDQDDDGTGSIQLPSGFTKPAVLKIHHLAIKALLPIIYQ